MKIEIEIDVDMNPRGVVAAWNKSDPAGPNVSKSYSLRKLVNAMINAGDQKTDDLEFLAKELRAAANRVDRYRKGETT